MVETSLFRTTEKERERKRAYYKANRSLFQARRAARYLAQRVQLFTQNLLKKYGITRETWDVMLIAQSGRCKVCGDPMDALYEPCVDHDHKTGKVRGLLCGPCNRAVGLLKDDPIRAENVAQYLRENASSVV